MKNIFSRLFGSRQNRRLATYRSWLAVVNAKADAFAGLNDTQLSATYQSLRQRYDNGETLPSLLPEVFAVVREAALRVLSMRPFDAQLIGGMALFEGNIAEMKTGEGKTLAATLPVCLEALTGKGVHVVTVNNYLARRDAEWMGALYHFLGLSVGVNVPEASMQEKAVAYRCDIVYGTNNEFGFDYLRDNMRYDSQAKLQQSLYYAIVDEVDSILIDEARTPLIISGEAGDNIVVYQGANRVAAQFTRDETPDSPGDFTVDEKARDIHLTEEGFARAETLFSEAGLLKTGSLYDPSNLSLMHHLNIALKARHLYMRDRDYVVQNDQVVIVDEFTGRLMPGRRWGDNLHQAVEAKEKLTIQKENQTLASISFQNYFRLYKKLGGMTGTALTEAEEFRFIYGLEVVEVPTHRKMIRRDELDRVYRTSAAKYRAVLADIRDCHEREQPVLVGTTAIEDSEKLSQLLQQENLPHEVLNAKQYEREAHIIAQAGQKKAITIATNMAGRGTDIVLGGNVDSERQALEQDESLSDKERQTKIAALQATWQQHHNDVLATGGLKIIGTERHESRRIDNQLRGRAGRQGDPGASTFYLSFEDSLLRIFATKRVAAIMEKLNLDDDEAIEARMVSRTIENAQRKVESHNFDIRRQLLEYDDIANEQRRLIYEQREHILRADDMASIATDLRTENLKQVIDEYLPPETPEEEWRGADLEKLLAGDYRLQLPASQWLANEEDKPREYFVERIVNEAEALYAEKIAHTDAVAFNGFLRSLTLNIIDEHWRAHLSALDGLRLSIGLRGMAQKNPKQEYKREAFEMFEQLLVNVQTMAARMMYALSVRNEPVEDHAAEKLPVAQEPQNLLFHHEDTPAISTPSPASPPADDLQTPPVTFRREAPKVRRNALCPCGSGKKYKQCCGKL